MSERFPHTVGWIGTGRMGFALAGRLIDSGVDLWVYNRTRAKAEPLSDRGAKVVDSPAALADRDIVFTMVAGPDDVMEVVFGSEGVLSGGQDRGPILVDSTTIDLETSRRMRDAAEQRGARVVAAPVSGNPKVVESGRLTVVASGPKDAFDVAEPYLREFGRKVTYVGPGDEARLVKICHNMLLGVVSQNLAEILVLAEASGVARADLMDFINDSVMGSMFTRYKTPALVNLDFEPTFTWHLLRKDLELGLTSGRELDVPLPTTALVHQILIEGIGLGYGDEDFSSLLIKEAKESGRSLSPEDGDVSDGLT
jgi:3-hydroxyisobutyrate dehydrogenase-like beta-hydroxyacid dehydrogenase